MCIIKKFKVGGQALILCAVLFLCCGVGYAQGQDSIQSLATSVLIERTKDLLKTDNPVLLLSYLEEILVRLQGMDDKDSNETRAFCLYQIGACRFQLENFPGAIKALQNFLEAFPEDPKVAQASLMIAEAYAMNQNWPGAEQFAKTLMDNKQIDPERRIFAMQLLGEALYSQEKWGEAVAPLREVFDAAVKPNDRNAAAIMLMNCYVKEKDFDNFLKFLSFCDDSIRQNLALNVALIEAGDQKVASGDYADALVLYRTVLTGAERLALYEKQNKEFTERLTEKYVVRVGTSRSTFDAEQEKMRRRIELNTKSMEQIRTEKGYDHPLEMRIGQCYTGMGRTQPALTLYRRFYTDFADSTLADDARFQAFAVLLDNQRWDEAIQEASDYLTAYPSGKFSDEVSLNQMQIFLQNGRVDEAQAAGFKALERAPDHRFIDQVKYLIGYIYFQKIEYEDALKTFQEVYETWPGSLYHEASDYWIAMSYLFLGQFDQAVEAFTRYLGNDSYSQQGFKEDASYRLGIALYGAQRFDEAELVFRRFLETFPGSALESEAFSMVGDLRGAEGDLEEALGYYEKALRSAVSIEQVTYATFQSAKTYELLEQYQEIIDLMHEYLAQNGESGNFAGAGFWLGKAYKAMGQTEAALKEYIRTVVKFGNKPENADVDLILRELIKENEEEGGWSSNPDIVEQLTDELEKARKTRMITLALRLQTLFAYISEGAERERYVDSILSGGDVENAGPLTLALIASEAAARDDFRTVHQAYAHCMEVFGESEILVEVMNVELQALFKEGKYEQVKALAEDITNRFGYREEVGLTRKLKGDAYRLSGDYELAIKTYKELFAIREWRGPLTPQSLYWIGVCKMQQGETTEAFAFFQRVYVMYEGYTEWAAKAYASSIECLKEQNKTTEIIRTYQEMVENAEIAATPEGQAARVELGKLLSQGGAQ